MQNTVMSEQGVEIYESQIELMLDQYISTHSITDMHKETQSRWNAALLYIYKYVFRDNKNSLKADNYYTGNLKYGNASNNGAYDLDKINRLCDIYIALCYEYEKEISIMGFSKLTGITTDTLHQWGAETSRPGSSASDIYKKLSAEREETLSNRLYSSKGHPVGILGILNRHYGWNMGQPRSAAGEKQQSLEQIQQRYGIAQQKDSEPLQLPDVDLSQD